MGSLLRESPAYPSFVAETMTHAIELAVGLGCVIAAVPALGRRPLRWLGVVLLVAGVAAIVHAASRLPG